VPKRGRGSGEPTQRLVKYGNPIDHAETKRVRGMLNSALAVAIADGIDGLTVISICAENV
jgi:hypothetical protein